MLGATRNLPRAWRPSIVNVGVQILLVSLGGFMVFDGALKIDASPLLGGAMVLIGLVVIVIAQPWLWLPRSHQPITTGAVHGQTGQVIRRRPPSRLAGLGLVLGGGAVAAAGVAYAVTTQGEDSGGGAALVLGGVGGAGLVVLGLGRLKSSNRTDLDLLVTSEGLVFVWRGELRQLGWSEIGEVEATVHANGGRNRVGFTPRTNVITLRGPFGEDIAAWKCRSFRCDPVEVLELLRRRSGDSEAGVGG